LGRKIGRKLEYFDRKEGPETRIGCHFGHDVDVTTDNPMFLRHVWGHGSSRSEARKGFVAMIRGKTLEICDGDLHGRSMTDCLCKRHRRVRVPRTLTTR
jgi:hypothetical protein